MSVLSWLFGPDVDIDAMLERNWQMPRHEWSSISLPVDALPLLSRRRTVRLRKRRRERDRTDDASSDNPPTE